MTQSDVRDRLVDAGLDLFMKRGFNATGVKEIVDTVGVPKGSFYTYFESKEMLGSAVVDRYWSRSAKEISALRDQAISPTVRLRRHFTNLAKSIIASKFATGCLLGKFSAEIAGQSPKIRSHVVRAFAEWSQAIGATVAEAAVAGELAPSLDRNVAADFLLNAWEGAVLRALADKSDKPFQQFMDVVFSLLFNLRATTV